jgi:two-component system NarL family sensor kinase
MAGQIGLTQGTYLIIGTAVLTLMMLAIISFALAFQRKLARKAEEFREIEKLMQKQELQSAYFVIEGQEQERKRIAAELHDNIGGLLATLKIYSDLSLGRLEEEDTQRLTHKINEISVTLGEEVRKLSHELDLRTLSGFGLKVAVEHLCEAVSDAGKILVTAVMDISRPVIEAHSLHLYRIIQELVTNTLKHSNATRVRIELTQIDDDITLIYEDNGQGFDLGTAKRGMGMQNIKTRVNQINGKLTLDSSLNGTTCIIEIINHA